MPALWKRIDIECSWRRFNNGKVGFLVFSHGEVVSHSAAIDVGIGPSSDFAARRIRDDHPLREFFHLGFGTGLVDVGGVS